MVLGYVNNCLKYIGMATTIAVIAVSPVSSFSQERKYPSQSYECSMLSEEYKKRVGHWVGRLHALEAELKLNEDRFTEEKIRNVKMALRNLTNPLVLEAEKNNCNKEGFESIESIVGN